MMVQYGRPVQPKQVETTDIIHHSNNTMNKILSNIVNNPKTTITGLLCGIAVLLSALGVIPKEVATLAMTIAGGGASTALIAHANDPKNQQ